MNNTTPPDLVAFYDDSGDDAPKLSKDELFIAQIAFDGMATTFCSGKAHKDLIKCFKEQTDSSFMRNYYSKYRIFFLNSGENNVYKRPFSAMNLDQDVYVKTTIDVKDDVGGVPMHSTVLAVFIQNVKQKKQIEGLNTTGFCQNETQKEFDTLSFNFAAAFNTPTWIYRVLSNIVVVEAWGAMSVQEVWSENNDMNSIDAMKIPKPSKETTPPADLDEVMDGISKSGALFNKSCSDINSAVLTELRKHYNDTTGESKNGMIYNHILATQMPHFPHNNTYAVYSGQGFLATSKPIEVQTTRVIGNRNKTTINATALV